MEIPVEKVIELVVKEVLTELAKKGIMVKAADKESHSIPIQKSNNVREEINMRNFRTPLLSENQILSIKPETSEIIIPKGTIITPGAKDIIRKRNLKLYHT